MGSRNTRNQKPAGSGHEVLTLNGLEELAEAVRPNCDSGYTITEIAAAAGIPRRTAYKRIAKLLSEGKCRKGWSCREDVAGKMQTTAVYEMAK